MSDKKIEDTGKTDRSGNKILSDIGQILKNEISDYLKRNSEVRYLCVIEDNYYYTC